MKTLKSYTYEEAVAMIKANNELEALYKELKPAFDENGPDFEYATDYVDVVVSEDFDENTDIETLTLIVSAFNPDWASSDLDYYNLDDAYVATFEVPTIEQAVCIIKDIEDAQGNIKVEN